MVICEIGTEYILQYIDKIMKQNKIKRVRFNKNVQKQNALVHFLIATY